MKKSFAIVVFSFIVLLIRAQENIKQKTEMADLMRSNGKIYVVIAVIITILAGLIIYLRRVDRKIGRLEKEAFNRPANT